MDGELFPTLLYHVGGWPVLVTLPVAHPLLLLLAFGVWLLRHFQLRDKRKGRR
jgi:hypothetical protein